MILGLKEACNFLKVSKGTIRRCRNLISKVCEDVKTYAVEN
jgi:hypothetical protein